MTPALEQIAKAIHANLGYGPHLHHSQCENAARAAVEVMKADVSEPREDEGIDYRTLWNAWLDAILREGQ